MNPFSLTFGKEPVNAISRDMQIGEIVDGLTSSNPEFQVCMITGVRGSGKTVMMTEIAGELNNCQGYGKLVGLRREIVHFLVDWLIENGYILQIRGKYPGLHCGGDQRAGHDGADY